jgi:general secretion pathway protein A
MYIEFYGLDALPFELSPDPKYLMMTPRHREALANLQYGISARKSLTLMTGEAGTGKTTLVNAALASAPCRDARIVQMSNSMLTRQEFMEFLTRAFHLSPETAQSKTKLLAELEDELLKRRAAGITTALVIDEAQCLERELLEEIRMLSNIETPSEKLLPLVLVGQPEFAERLNLPSLRQLKQRVALRCELGTLTAEETAAYIAGRVRIAGGQASIMFTREATEQVHRLSGGIPRTISVICDNALVNGFALGIKPVHADLIREVGADFDLDKRAAMAPMVSPQPALPHDTRTAAELRPSAAPQGRQSPVGHVAPQRPSLQPTPATAAGEDPDRPLFDNFKKKRRFSFF